MGCEAQAKRSVSRFMCGYPSTATDGVGNRERQNMLVQMALASPWAGFPHYRLQFLRGCSYA